MFRRRNILIGAVALIVVVIVLGLFIVPRLTNNAQGCSNDRDCDTVVDASDACPDTPGTVANNGCTTNSNLGAGMGEGADSAEGDLTGTEGEYVPPANVQTLLHNLEARTVKQTDDKGNQVTTLQGFDLAEYGGNDSRCERTETETIHLGEVVSSAIETCKVVVEWSLKLGDQTLVAGVYSVTPGEWFYVPLAVAGVNDSLRVVGTIWYLPKNWNGHMFSANLAAARDARDGTVSIVGLSPTDDMVMSVIDAHRQ